MIIIMREPRLRIIKSIFSYAYEVLRSVDLLLSFTLSNFSTVTHDYAFFQGIYFVHNPVIENRA